MKKNTYLLFLVAQALSAGAAAAGWLLLRRPLPEETGNWPVGVGIALVALLSLAIFLLLGKKGHFLRLLGLERLSLHGVALFLISFFVAALTGPLARNVIPYFLKGTLSPLVKAILFCLCVGLPFLVFDLLLLTGDRLVRSLRADGLGRFRWAARLFGKLDFLWDRHPLAASLLVCIIFYAAFFLAFHAGYETNDDVAMIAIVSGYLGGAASPMLVFGNVLLGFLLNLLYRLPTRLNWEILLFIALNFLSIWAMLYQLFVRLRKPGLKLLVSLAILSCDAYFLIKINFTSIAAMAALAGGCVLVLALQAASPLRKWSLASGVTLILAASLIRMESMLLILLAILPAALVYWHNFSFRRLTITGAVAALLVGGCYAFNRVYVNSFPEWRVYNLYNQVCRSLRDTPRVENLASTYREVGWSENDYLLFVRWFNYDRQVYSLENLQALAAVTPPRRASLAGTLSLFSDSLFRLLSLPYLWLMLAVWLAMLYCRVPFRKGWLPSLLTAVACLGIVLALILMKKIPNRVLLPTLSASVIFGFFAFVASAPERTADLPAGEDRACPSWLAVNSLVLAVLLAVGLVFLQQVITSRLNLTKQAAYRQIVSDITALQENGRIPPGSLIATPAVGIPLEWADPLVLDFPTVQYLSQAWLTQSPLYDAVLEKYGVGSLPAGFYQSDHVYLMETSARLDGIRQFILEHEGVQVEAATLYEMPNRSGDPNYDQVGLYQLTVK